MRQIQFTEITSVLGTLTALIAGLITATVMGGVLYAIQRYTGFYLIVVFPTLAGAVTGWALSKAIIFGNVTNGAVAALIGLIAAAVLVGTPHYGKYQLEFKDEGRRFLISKNLPVTDQAVDETTDEILRSEIGATGFIGFLQLEARHGISITRSLMISSSGFELRGIWHWVYSAAEFGIVLSIVVGIGATAPFSQTQQQQAEEG